MEILLIAYALTGMYKVMKAFRLDFHNRPTYVRRRHYGAILLMVLGWAPFDVGVLLSRYRRDTAMRREAVSNLLTFAVLLAAGFAFL